MLPSQSLFLTVVGANVLSASLVHSSGSFNLSQDLIFLESPVCMFAFALEKISSGNRVNFHCSGHSSRNGKPIFPGRSATFMI